MKSYTETGSVQIEKIVPGGQGLGTRGDGKKGFFWNALPGEVVTEYTVVKEKSSYFEAVAKKILEPSSHRTEPCDPCYLSTSPWQVMEYEYELEQKGEILREIFRDFMARGPVATDLFVTDGQDYRYRNKMEYALYWDNELQKIRLAFHARGSHQKLPIEQSSIERPEIFAYANKIIDELNARHEEARKYQSLLLRCNQRGEVSGGLYENGKPHPVFDNLKDEILGQEYSYSPNGFFQINLPVYEMALREIKKYIKTDNVLDLYAGVGTIGLSVARDKDLTLVECDGAAFAELKQNCFNVSSSVTTDSPTVLAPVAPSVAPAASVRTPATSSLAEAVHAKSEETLEYIAPEQTVILDPPRAGCDKKLVEKLLEVKPQTIIYLSCNPVTQARDVKMLTEKYHIVDIMPFNFFPRTPHLENLVVLDISQGE